MISNFLMFHLRLLWSWCILTSETVINIYRDFLAKIIYPFLIGELTEEEIEDSYKQLAPTTSTSFNHMIVKHGSIQKFIDNAEEASDYGHGCFSEE